MMQQAMLLMTDSTFQLGALWPLMEAKCLETRSKSHGCYIESDPNFDHRTDSHR